MTIDQCPLKLKQDMTIPINKKLGTLLLGTALLLGPTSCSDFLSENAPSNLTASEFYTLPDHAEAAIASVQWTFDTLRDDAVWAITSTENRASRAVMKRIGMEYLPDLDFDHPKVGADSPLLRHVTYSVDRDAWTQNRNLYEPK